MSTKPGGITYLKHGEPIPMPNDQEPLVWACCSSPIEAGHRPDCLNAPEGRLVIKTDLDFSTLEVRIIEHLVDQTIVERIKHRQKMLSKKSSRHRESDAEFDMALQPLYDLQEKVSLWLNARRGTSGD